MSRTIRLEFVVTPEERSEAQSLALRRPFGGSKWLTLAAMWAMAACMVGGAYFSVEPGERPLWGGIFIVVWIVVLSYMRRARKRPGDKAVLDISPEVVQLTTAAATAR